MWCLRVPHLPVSRIVFALAAAAAAAVAAAAAAVAAVAAAREVSGSPI